MKSIYIFLVLLLATHPLYSSVNMDSLQVNGLFDSIYGRYMQVNNVVYTLVSTQIDTNNQVIKADTVKMLIDGNDYYALFENIRIYYDEEICLYIDDENKTISILDPSLIVHEEGRENFLKQFLLMKGMIKSKLTDEKIVNGDRKLVFELESLAYDKLTLVIDQQYLIKNMLVHHNITEDSELASEEISYINWVEGEEINFEMLRRALVRKDSAGLYQPGLTLMDYVIIQ